MSSGTSPSGEDPPDAAINGRSEIGLAAIVITLVDVVVFLPISFLPGSVGLFLREFGLVVTVATLDLAVRLVHGDAVAGRPLGAALALEALEDHRGLRRAFEAVRDVLRRTRTALGPERPRTVSPSPPSRSSLALARRSARAVGFEYIPPVDRGELYVTISFPSGTPLQTTRATECSRSSGSSTRIRPAGRIVDGRRLPRPTDAATSTTGPSRRSTSTSTISARTRPPIGRRNFSRRRRRLAPRAPRRGGSRDRYLRRQHAADRRGRFEPRRPAREVCGEGASRRSSRPRARSTSRLPPWPMRRKSTRLRSRPRRARSTPVSVRPRRRSARRSVATLRPSLPAPTASRTCRSSIRDRLRSLAAIARSQFGRRRHHRARRRHRGTRAGARAADDHAHQPPERRLPWSERRARRDAVERAARLRPRWRRSSSRRGQRRTGGGRQPTGRSRDYGQRDVRSRCVCRSYSSIC